MGGRYWESVVENTGKVLGEPARKTDHAPNMGVGARAGARLCAGAIPGIRLLPGFSGISDKLPARKIHHAMFMGRDR